MAWFQKFGGWWKVCNSSRKNEVIYTNCTTTRHGRHLKAGPPDALAAMVHCLVHDPTPSSDEPKKSFGPLHGGLGCQCMCGGTICASTAKYCNLWNHTVKSWFPPESKRLRLILGGIPTEMIDQFPFWRRWRHFSFFTLVTRSQVDDLPRLLSGMWPHRKVATRCGVQRQRKVYPGVDHEQD